MGRAGSRGGGRPRGQHTAPGHGPGSSRTQGTLFRLMLEDTPFHGDSAEPRRSRSQGPGDSDSPVMLRLETDKSRTVCLLKERCSGDVMDSHIAALSERCRGGGDDGVMGRLRSPRSGEADSTLHSWKGASLSKS